MIQSILFALPLRGIVAVDLFFVLSAYLIAHSYDGKLRNRFSARKFITARAIRQFALYASSLH